MATEQSHGHQHGRSQGQRNDLQESHEAIMADTLDQDALLLHEHVQEILDWTAKHQPTPGVIMDLGAGTGTGTLGLMRTFPQARLVAVDQSEFMLARLASAVEKQQLSNRVDIQKVDLDTTWPELAGVDLIWAASSLHHMSDPTHILSQIRKTLARDGLLVVVEMDALPRYLPDDLGFGSRGLEQRLHDTAALAGWNAHPDWSLAMREAGLQIVEQRTFAYDTDKNGPLIARNAQMFLSKMRNRTADTLAPEDLATIDQLLDPYSPHSLSTRTDLSMRGSRTVWVGRPSP